MPSIHRRVRSARPMAGSDNRPCRCTAYAAGLSTEVRLWPRARAVHPAVASSDGNRACATQPSRSAYNSPYSYTSALLGRARSALAHLRKHRSIVSGCLRGPDFSH
jgi:hypothetical protein